MRPTTARRTVWGVTTALSLLVGAYAVALVASGFDLVPDDVAANSFLAPLGLRLHIVGAGIALVLGPWQFVRGLRQRVPRVHRVTGRLYVAGVLVGGVAGGAIALGTTGGPVAGFGFLALAVAWVGTTAVALAQDPAARRGRPPAVDAALVRAHVRRGHPAAVPGRHGGCRRRLRHGVPRDRLGLLDPEPGGDGAVDPQPAPGVRRGTDPRRAVSSDRRTPAGTPRGSTGTVPPPRAG